MRRLVIALALLLVAAVPAIAAPNRAQVKRFLLSSPSVSKGNKAQLRETGFGGGLDRLVYGDLTGDGQNDVIATIASGGTAGDIAFYVLSGDDGGLHVLKASNEEYKIGVAIVKGQLQVTRPIYRKTDPNCCPAHLSVTTYRYDGTRLVAATKRTIKTPR